jgi:hypothetical protein
MMTESVTDKMKFFAENAVEIAKKRYQTILDFSEGSIQEVEKILGAMYESRPQRWLGKLLGRGLSKRQLERAAIALGAYMGEVMRLSLGGEWREENILNYDGVITLKVNDTNLFPTGKVYKRLVNGPEDDVWHYYKLVSQNMLARSIQD